jgi:hypothetical protein
MIQNDVEAIFSAADYYVNKSSQQTATPPPHNAKQENEAKRVTATPVPLSALSHISQPIIDIQADRKDFTQQNLSLENLQQLNKEVENNAFIGHIIWGTLPSGEQAHKLRSKIEQKVIKNNQAYKRYPNDFIHALLSLNAYETSHQINTNLVFGSADHKHYEQYLIQWKINEVHDYPEFGRYYAVSYTNTQTRQLVLAHRGTTFEWMDLFNTESPSKTNLTGVLAGDIVAQQKLVYSVTKRVAEYARDNHYHFSTTGHSLGAWLAEISVYYSVFEFKHPTKAVTFDSPGSIKMVDFGPNILTHENTRDIKHLEITTYLSAPNFVNTCHRHIGQVYQLYPDYEKEKWRISKVILPKYEALWSIFGHSLTLLLATFDPITGKPPRDKITRMARWPVINYFPRKTTGQHMLTGFKNIGAKLFGEEKFGPLYQETNEELLIISLLKLIIDIGKARIDHTQYLKCWELLQSPPTEITSSKEKIGYEFSLKYEASYEPASKDPATNKLITNYKGTADWYLKKLYECPVDKITQYFGENSLITQQLNTIKAQYYIKIDQGCYQLVATGQTPIEELKENILRLLEEQVTRGEVKAFLKTHVHISSRTLPPFEITSDLLPLFPTLGKRYITRIEDFYQLDKLLAGSSYVIIKGEPGFGKTSLANEYGHRQKDRPNHAKLVIKIDADSQEKVINAYQMMASTFKLAVEQYSAEEIMHLVHHKITLSHKPVLFIFDNVENATYLTPYIDYLPQSTKAIITTRHSRLIEGAPNLQVRPFNCQEATQYICSSAIKNRIEHPQEVQALIDHYAKGTGYINPYHLNRAIGIIKQRPIGGIKNYLTFINVHPDYGGELILQQKLMATSRLAWPMLQYAAYLDPDFIDLSIFTQLFQVTEEELTEAIKILESLSAMTIVRKPRQEGLTLHRLTQGIVKDFIHNPAHQAICLTKTEIMSQLISSLNQLCPDVEENPQGWQQVKKLMVHIEVLLAQENPLINFSVAELFDKSGSYATTVLGNYLKAHRYYENALTICQLLHPESPHAKVAHSLDALGSSYTRLGGADNLQKGLDLQKQAWVMRQRLYGEGPHPEVAHSLNNIGMTYEALGGAENQQKGLHFQTQALVMRQELYGQEPHPEVARSLNNVGMSYEALSGTENQRKGLWLQEQALTMLQALHGEEPHPDVAHSLNNIGISYKNLGGTENQQKGLSLQEQALRMRLVLYGDQPHHDIANSFNNIGRAYADLGGIKNQQLGLALQEYALARLQRLYGDQPHPDVASFLNNVGSTYGQLEGIENRQEGLTLQKQALAMRRALYGDQAHFEVANSLDSIGRTYLYLGGVTNQQKGMYFQKRARVMLQTLYGD